MDGNEVLKSNNGKILSLLLRTPTVGPLCNIRNIIIGNNNITPSLSARNLIGVIFDEHLTMKAHVSSVGYEGKCHHCPGPSHFRT